MKPYILIALLNCAILLSCNAPDSAASLEASITSEAKETKKQSVVFIAGFDGSEDGNNYYAKAAAHFKSKKMKVVEDRYSLEEIMTWLVENKIEASYSNIHIVSHSNAWRGMSLPITPNGDRISQKSLTQTLAENGLPVLDHRITSETNLIFHSCGLGKNESLLRLFKAAFSSEVSPRVYASPHFNVFGSKFASHYLAKAYYVYYPTAQSKGPRALAEAIEKTYPETNIDWFTALKSRTETKLGAPYSYRFNIPVDWDISFEDAGAMPNLVDRDAIMDWVVEQENISTALFELGIPIEQFRWTAISHDRGLQIKAKTTIVCVLVAVTNKSDASEYATATIDDASLYTCL